MNTAVFKLSRLAVESQTTFETISLTLAMRGVTRAKRKSIASVFMVYGLDSSIFILLLLHKLKKYLPTFFFIFLVVALYVFDFNYIFCFKTDFNILEQKNQETLALSNVVHVL